MSEFITPVVGQQYRLGDEVVEVVEAVKKRYWRIMVRPLGESGGNLIPQSEWAAKAQRVES
jgi:hypothetical protein